MIVHINGSYFKSYKLGKDITPISFEYIKRDDVNNKIDHLFRNIVIPSSVGLGTLLASNSVYAEEEDKIGGLSEQLMPLINMIQDLALPIGIGVATWGLIEIIIGNFGSGKSKIKYAVIGFAGMFIIPEVFYAIRTAFQ